MSRGPTIRGRCVRRVAARSPRGFTLIEVVVALVLLELGLLGVFGTLLVASRTLARAEALERGTTALEGVADSLRAAGVSEAGERPFPGGAVTWAEPDGGALALAALSTTGDTLVTLLVEAP